jgi:hypothetical protein
MFRLACVFACALGPGAMVFAQQPGTFVPTGNMTVARAQHSATLLADGRVLIAGGSARDIASASTEIYDPATGTFRAAAPMISARRLHTATLLPDDRVLIVGGYDNNRGVLASAELYDPATGTFTATGSLATGRGGHSAILLASGKVLIIGGYGWNAYPNVAPAELYDPAMGTFIPAGAYAGHDGCDFCAPSVLLPDGTVLFPGQYPAQLYDPVNDVFSTIGQMLYDQSTAVTLMTGQVLFAGGAPIGRIADAELYNPTLHTFVATGSMAARRVWHSLIPLPDGTALATGGETEACVGFGCTFAGTLATAELYDPATGAFAPAGSMSVARETHTATLLADGRVLIAGGESYGGIGIFNGSTATADLYSPSRLIAAPVIMSLSGDGAGLLDVYAAGLPAAFGMPPQVVVGGRLAEVVQITSVPGETGQTRVRVRVPMGIAAEPGVRVRLTYLDRSSNEVTVATR